MQPDGSGLNVISAESGEPTQTGHPTAGRSSPRLRPACVHLMDADGLNPRPVMQTASGTKVVPSLPTLERRYLAAHPCRRRGACDGLAITARETRTPQCESLPRSVSSSGARRPLTRSACALSWTQPTDVPNDRHPTSSKCHVHQCRDLGRVFSWYISRARPGFLSRGDGGGRPTESNRPPAVALPAGLSSGIELLRRRSG